MISQLRNQSTRERSQNMENLMEKHPEKSVPAKDVHDGVKLLDSGVNFVGEQVSYPKGKARIRSVLATMAPGQKTGWHKHGVPTYGYILEGQITVDYGDGGKTTYRAGEGVLEAMDYWHEGINDGDVPARVVVVFMGAEGAENVIYKPEDASGDD
ncbi:MAG TPA: cupin domain-containing protein [Thalassospira sp.]|nr:cupin domain-containing protein [Thalassospira sp.]HBS25059.1 cupin domain-containing protein [Thalassospira sp.]